MEARAKACADYEQRMAQDLTFASVFPRTLQENVVDSSIDPCQLRQCNATIPSLHNSAVAPMTPLSTVRMPQGRERNTKKIRNRTMSSEISLEISHGETPQRPVTPTQAYNPRYWHRTAERARLQARAVADDTVAARLQREAADCDRLAARAEAILAAQEAAQPFVAPARAHRTHGEAHDGLQN
jgi:hypothetical protein